MTGMMLVLIGFTWSIRAYAEADTALYQRINQDYPWDRINRALQNFKSNRETIADLEVLDLYSGVALDGPEIEFYEIYKQAALKLNVQRAENVLVFDFLIDHSDCAVNIKKPLPPRSFDANLSEDQIDVIHSVQEFARQGNPKMQLLLGYMYMRGDIVEKDTKQGEYWIHQAYPHTVKLSGAIDCPYDVIERM